MRRWLVVLALLGAVAPASGQEEPEVRFLSPPAGAAIDGTPWVTVTGWARAPRVPATTGFDVMLILDTSGSTAAPAGGFLGKLGGRLGAGRGFPFPPGLGESILEAEVKAALNFLTQVDRTRVRVGLVTFSGDYQRQSGSAIPGGANAWVIQPLTFDHQAVRAALSRVLARGPDGGTDMAAGLRLGVKELLALEGAASSARPDARKVGLLLTDGFPTLPFGLVSAQDPGDLDVTLNAARLAAKGSVLVHTFCLGPEALGKPMACTEIARITGGRHHLVETPADIVEILPRTSIGSVELLSVRNVTTGHMARSLVVGSDGHFTAQVPLVPGENRVVADLLGGAGAHKSAVLVVRYGQPEVQIQVDQDRQPSLEIQIERPGSSP